MSRSHERSSLRARRAGLLLFALMVGALLLHVPGADSVGSELSDEHVRRRARLGARRSISARVRVAVVRPLAAARRSGSCSASPSRCAPSCCRAPPFLSSDIYRYVWDGQVQAAGINPYRYVPADPALAGLRGHAVFPRHQSRGLRADHLSAGRAGDLRRHRPGHLDGVRHEAGDGGVRGGRHGLHAGAASRGRTADPRAADLCLEPARRCGRSPATGTSTPPWSGCSAWRCSVVPGTATVLAGAVLAAAALVQVPADRRRARFPARRRFWRPAPGRCGRGRAAVRPLSSPPAGMCWASCPPTAPRRSLDSGGGIWLLSGLSHVVALPRWRGALYMLAVAGLAGAAGCGDRPRPADGSGGRRGRALPRRGDPGRMRDGRDQPALSVVFRVAGPALRVVAPIPAVIWLSVAPVALYLDPLHRPLRLAVARLCSGRRPRVRRLAATPLPVPQQDRDYGRTPLMQAATTLKDPRRYFEDVGRVAVRVGRDAARLPLSGGDQPLQPAVRDLSAHLRGRWSRRPT